MKPLLLHDLWIAIVRILKGFIEMCPSARVLGVKHKQSELLIIVSADSTTTAITEASKLYGFLGNDTLSSGDNNDVLDGGSGNDRLEAGEGNDTLYGGNGEDTLSGGHGDNYIIAGNGHDVLIAGSGEDTLYGHTGNDTLKDGAGNDIYYGQAGNDSLSDDIESDGIDTLDGGIGNDTLNGAGGNNIYIFNQDYGSDTILDYIRVPRSARPATIDSGGDNDTLIFGNGITLDNLNWSFDGDDLVFTLSNSASDSLTIENYLNPIYRIENIQVEGQTIVIEEDI